jgi:hypothetical protein
MRFPCLKKAYFLEVTTIGAHFIKYDICTVAAVENSDTLTTPNFWLCKWY